MLQSRVQLTCNRSKLRVFQRRVIIRTFSPWKPKRLVPDFYPQNSRPLPFVESWREKMFQSSGSTGTAQLLIKDRQRELNFFFELMRKLFGKKRRIDTEEIISSARYHLQKARITVDDYLLEELALESIRQDAPSVVPLLLRTALLLNVVVNTNIYENIGQSLVDKRHWIALEDMLAFCFNNHITFSPTLLNIHLRAMLHFEDYSSLQLDEVVQLFTSHDCQLTRRSWNLLIEAAVANRDMPACRDVIKRMESAGFPINEETHNAVLSRMFTLGPNHALENDIFTSLWGIDSHLDTSILNSLIRLRSIARDDAMLKNYTNHLQKMRRGGSKNKPGSYPDAWTQILPDATTISILVEHFSRRHDLKGAQNAFSLFTRLNMSPSPADVAHLLTTYSKMGYMQQALALMSTICDTLPRHVRSQVESSLQKLGWDQMGSGHAVSGVSINIYILNALVSAVMGTHGLKGFSTVLDIMDTLHITPDDDTARLLLFFIEKYEPTNSDFLVAVLHRLSTHSGVRVRPQMRHLNIILHSILLEHGKLVKGKGGWKGASAFLSESRGRKLPVNMRPRTFEHARKIFDITDGMKESELVDRASLRYILRSIKSTRANPDHATYSIMMFYYARIAKDANSVERLYKSLVQNGLRPNAYHVAALIEAYCIAGEVERAEDVLVSAQANQVTVNRVLYSLIICAYGNLGNPDKGHEVFKRMLETNVTPDIICLECVIRGYFMIRDYDTARKLLLHYWETVAPRSTVPPDHITLGDALSLLRQVERKRHPKPPKLGESVIPVLKEIIYKWRKLASRQIYDPSAPSVQQPSFIHVESPSEDASKGTLENIEQEFDSSGPKLSR